LLYECNPLAFICQQAGGAAIDGSRDIMEVMPDELHQRSPLYLGSKDSVDTARELLAQKTVAV
jgi:fructose-1,6-bisphosphatase I